MTASSAERTPWITVGALADSFAPDSNALVATDDLAGRTLSLHFADGNAADYRFMPGGTLAIGSADAEIAYRATTLRPDFYFVDFLNPGLVGSSTSLFLDVGVGVALRLVGSLPRREATAESLYRRAIAQQELTSVTADFAPASIGAPFDPAQPHHHETADLIGLRIRHRYNPNELYEHIYLSQTRYCWHCLEGAEAGLADVERCHYYAIAQNLYLFVWREKIIPTLGVVLLDLDALKTTGKIMGYRDESFDDVTNFPIGAVSTIVQSYPGRTMSAMHAADETASPLLRAEQVAVAIGSFEILRDVTFTANRGEFLSVVGPSGCGKTTLLMCLAGLIGVTGGGVRFDGRTVSSPPAGLSVVFQDYSRSLLPWKRNLDNVVFGMKRDGALSKAAKLERAAELMHAVGLDGFEKHYPWQLSGGMQQRVAIARALATRPKVLLLDEPLAAVDAQTRADMQDLLIQLSRTYDQTCLLITHDVDEAIYVADRVIVLSNRPTQVVRDLPISLPRDRDQVTTKSLPEFLAKREEILTLIRSMRAGAKPT